MQRLFGKVSVISNTLLMQWGKTTERYTTTADIILPITYTTILANVSITTYPYDSDTTVGKIMHMTKIYDKSSFTANVDGWATAYIGICFDWTSIGY